MIRITVVIRIAIVLTACTPGTVRVPASRIDVVDGDTV